MQALETYNVFCRRRQPELCCAVRQDWLIPSFIENETWRFKGFTGDGRLPPGFHPDAAQEGMKLIGYYLFHTISSGPDKKRRHGRRLVNFH
ncbi:hypothetical protein [Methylobacterium oxalidis]|uniref:hypothetical protein n=1 Tax=Methylobacterium oxalidis TaxID=944322 RepID=UPI003315B299